MRAVAASRAGTPSAASRFSWRILVRCPLSDAASLGAVSRRGLSERPKIRLRELEQLSRVASGPGVCERERRHIGDRRDELLDLGDSDGLALRPGRDLVDLVREPVQVVFTDQLHQQGTGVGFGLDPGLTELLRHPGNATSLRDVEEQQVADLRACLGERRVLLHLEPDQGEHGIGRRRPEVRGDRLDVRCLPTARRRTLLVLLRPVDVCDDDESRIAEKAAGVAERDRVRPARPRAPTRSPPPPARNGPGGAAPQSRPSVDRSPRSGRRASATAVRSSPYRTPRSVRTVSERPSDSSTIRPFWSVRNTVRPGRRFSAARVSARGWP